MKQQNKYDYKLTLSIDKKTFEHDVNEMLRALLTDVNDYLISNEETDEGKNIIIKCSYEFKDLIFSNYGKFISNKKTDSV